METGNRGTEAGRAKMRVVMAGSNELGAAAGTHDSAAAVWLPALAGLPVGASVQVVVAFADGAPAVELTGFVRACATEPEDSGRRHQGEKKVLVVGAVEDRGERSGRIRLAVVAAATTELLCGFIGSVVERKATVRTDGLPSYKALGSEGFRHVAQNRGAPKNASKQLPHVHRVFSLLKRLLLGTYQGAVSHKHLGRYLDEFVFRFNRRASGSRWLLFQRLVASCFVKAPTQRAIVASSLLVKAA